MNTKLLYVLVSTPDDNYLEMAHVSIFSAKYYMPDCHVVLLVDKKTEDLMDENRRKILNNVDEYIVIPLENATTRERSRLIKCNARNYVKGDFLYIDNDTIIAKPLYEIDNVTASIAAVRDTHCEFSDNPYKEMDIALCNAIGYSIENDTIFFNGGVMYVKDDKLAHDFYDMWINEWIMGREKGVLQDQPALAKTNYQMGFVIQLMDDTWNVEFLHGMKYMKDAKIVHYLTTNAKGGENQPFLLKSSTAFTLLKQDLENVNTDYYIRLIKDPFSGINALTTIVAGPEVYLRHTWLYSVILDWYLRGEKFNRIQSLLKTIAELKMKISKVAII